MPGYAMPGMGQQASPKFTQQRGSKIWFVCSLAAGSRGVSRPEAERHLQEQVACTLALSGPGGTERRYSEAWDTGPIWCG